MRYTPFLDERGVKISDDVPDHAANVLDAALAALERTVDWGEHEGKKRKPCTGQPILLAGMPLGQYHCEGCGLMQMAGEPHFDVDEDYEAMTGRDWPAGYEDGD